jgi:tRNA synthetases class I (M)
MSTAVLMAVAWAHRNGARHIGHKSGSGVASGVFARCYRMAGNRVLMVSRTDEPQGLPEVDAPFASGESAVSFQRLSIAGGAQPLGQRNRPADAAPEPGATPLGLTGSHSVRISFADRRHPPSCTGRETGASPAGKSSPDPGRHDGGHPDVSAAVEGRLDRGGGHARFPNICDRRQRGSRDLEGARVATVASSRFGNGVGCATASGEHHRPTAAETCSDIGIGDLPAVHQHSERRPVARDDPGDLHHPLRLVPPLRAWY